MIQLNPTPPDSSAELERHRLFEVSIGNTMGKTVSQIFEEMAGHYLKSSEWGAQILPYYTVIHINRDALLLVV